MGMGDVKERARHGAKARDLETHARKRFDVRFDVEWTPGVRREVVWMIQTGRSHFIEKQSNAISLHRVTVQGKDVVVVYDKIRACVVTALYPKGEWPTLESDPTNPTLTNS
jgi:hypothetical protein